MKSRLVYAAVILLALVTTSIPFVFIATAPVPVVSLSPVDQIMQMRAITPFIEALDPSGGRLWEASGVRISAHYVLTAAHVIGDADHWLVDGHVARSATISADKDTALLYVDDAYDGPVAEISTDTLKVGDPVMVCGWMVGLGLETTWGQVANVTSDPKGWGEGDLVVAIVCTFGASGGPVFSNGKLVGVVSRGQDSLLVVSPVELFGL
jgi:S1-C subfamily serine protease